MGVRRSSVAAIAVVALSAAAAGGATSARAVRVGDTNLTPARTRVAVGGSVSWRNVGRRPHRITSVSGAWRPFTLRPSGSRTHRFPRAGVYPYRVDGRRCGVVGVGRAPTGSCAGGGATSARIVHYDVSLTAKMAVQYDFATNGGTGHKEGTTQWTGTWRNVALRVFDFPTSLVVGLVRKSAQPGTLGVTFSFAVTDPRNGSCSGGFTNRPFGGILLVSGSAVARSALSSFTFRSQVASGNAWSAARTDAYNGACGAGSTLANEAALIDNGFVFRDWQFTGSNGLTADFDHPSLVAAAGFSRKTGRPFPLRLLSAGRSFTITLGHEWADAAGTAQASLRARFTPRR